MSAETLKEEGNAAFKANDFITAITKFTEALKLEPDNTSYYSNRSAAYLKKNDFDKALEDGKKCVELNPTWGKGYSRQGSALFMKGDYPGAIGIYAQGLAHDPTDQLLTQGLQQAQKKLAGGETKKKKGKKGGKKGKKVEEEEEQEATPPEDIDHVIGIDLGTTYSCVGVWIDGGVKILETATGEKTIPSYVAFTDGQRLVGHAAKAQGTRNPLNTVYDVKRIIGQRWTDTGVAPDCARFPFKVSEGPGGKPQIEVTVNGEEKQKFQAEQISALVLSYCKEIAEKFLGKAVSKAVITVPAYFNDSQRAGTKAAGAIAGLEVMRIINEPTAAALAYGLDQIIGKKDQKAVNVLIFDLGGGTFDVSILTIEGGIFTVKATGGDTRLGGEDFDNSLVEYLIVEVEKQGMSGVKEDARAFSRLRSAAELAKRELSSAQQTDIKIDGLKDNKNFSVNITRSKLEQVNRGHFTVCMDTVKRVLKDAKMKTTEIDEIVLVGGSTRIPKIQEMLSQMFEGRLLCKSVNPDEAVAYGAAVQGAILSGQRNSKTDDVLLMDVTPLSLGIETTGRVMSVIIPRNTPIPCVKTQTYTTDANYQTKVDVCVYEGERLKSDENNLLGEFTISGIESAKRGEPQVDVSFSIDSNGILTVAAKDQKTGAEANISIQNRSRASNEEVEKMIKEAEKFKAEDSKRIKKVEAKNELEATIFEAFEIAKTCEDGNLASILEKAADKEQAWIDDNYETASPGDIAMRRRGLERRMQGKGR